MTDTYLYKPGSAALNSNGQAVISLAPDTGQWWKPTLVHVSNGSGVPQQAFLYSGAPASAPGQVNPPPHNFLKDSTFQAQNDISSILSGTIIQRGEAVTVWFFAGMPGDVVSIEIFGISSDVPPPQGILPDVPGIRFSGAFAGLTNQTIFVDNQNITLGNNASTGFPPGTTAFYSGNMDNLTLVFDVTTGAAELSISWFDDIEQSTNISNDFIDNNSTATSFEQSVPVKGPWFTVGILAGPAGCHIDNLIIADGGSMASIGNDQGVTQSLLLANDGFSVAAGTHTNLAVIGPYAGQVSIMGYTKDLTAFNWSMELLAVDIAGGLTPVWFIDQRHVQQTDHVYLPAMPIRLDVVNGDSVAHNFTIIVTRHPFYQLA